MPGQVFYNTTRKLVLKGADGVVFVDDSQPGMMEQNLESPSNPKENLKGHGLDPETVPFVIQYNKRAMPGALSVEEMRRILNPRGVPDFETTATTGQGIMEAMKAVCRIVLEEIQKKQKGPAAKGAGSREEPEELGRAELRPMVRLAVDLGLSGPGIFDLQIGLIALEGGADVIWTHDAGFVPAPGLRVEDPLSA